MKESEALTSVGLLIDGSPLFFFTDNGVTASGLSNGEIEPSESFPAGEREERNRIGLKEVVRSAVIAAI